MMTLGAIGFLQPWVLAGLLALPVIWLLLRFTPPRPRRQPFPPFRLLLGLSRTEETPDRSPWWLTALRILTATLIILAFAGPVLNPTEFAAEGDGPLVVVVDDGWAAASRWDVRKAFLTALVESAERRGRPVLFAAAGAGELAIERAEDALKRIGALAPDPLPPARADLIERLRPALAEVSGAELVWLADGLDYGHALQFAEDLTALAPDAPFTVFLDEPAHAPLWVTPARLEEDALAVTVARAAPGGARLGEVGAFALNGRPIDRQPFALAAGETETVAAFTFPADLRNQVARIEIVGQRSAGAVTLLDERWQRRIVAMLAGGSVESAQPLLAPLFYVERALEPFAELRRPVFGEAVPEVKDLIADGLSMMVLADVGTLIESDHDALADWVKSGGTLVRFAGPRLAAAGDDDLLPVRIRAGGRSLGGALSWEAPQELSPFDGDSPFAGLEVPEDVTVERQILAEPDVTLAERTWARLADGTPIVTANQFGNGRIVLFHLTANADWSNLPLSGLFLDMMQRLLDLSQGVAGAAPVGAGDVSSQFLNPNLLLDGEGRLATPPPTARPLARADIAEARPSLQHPPGFYGPATARFALNPIAEGASFAALPAIPGADVRGMGGGEEVALLPWIVIAAIVLLIADAIAVLTLSGQLSARVARPVAGALLVAALLGAGVAPGPALAQEPELSVDDRFAMDAVLTTRLAYVVTGDSEVDAVSLAGMVGLTRAITGRTSLEPGSPVGINVERDELVFFPIIYWPVIPEVETPSEEALARIDAYMKHGGTLFFDTRDEPLALPSSGLRRDTPALSALQRLLSKLDIPPLEPVPANHVLTKAFYLLQSFPGRFEGGSLWVEASSAGSSDVIDPTDRSNADGITSILIGSNDFAGAWAIDETGRPLLPTGTGDERQREMAYRVGINVVMYALTGNYKADQVHIPALLERLGQ